MATFEEGISDTLSLLRRKGGLTRAQIVDETGLSRSAVNLRIDALLRGELVARQGADSGAKGRPAEAFVFNRHRGKVLVADVGATKYRAGLCDLAGEVLAEVEHPADVTTGPHDLLTSVLGHFEDLLSKAKTKDSEVLAIALGLPAPIRQGSGMTVNPPIMPRWNRFDVSQWFARRFDCPVFLEKDANAMAFGEARVTYPDVDELLFVKLGTGIGSGLVHNGKLFRGAHGGAGDLGHIPVNLLDVATGPLCKCGNRGCLEAHAGGWAIVRDLNAAGLSIHTQEDLVDALAAGEPTTVETVREAGRAIGSALAAAVNLTNPKVVVIGGQIAAAGESQLLPPIRERLYARSLALATAELTIDISALNPRAGLVGLAHLIGDEILAPSQIGRLLPRP